MPTTAPTISSLPTPPSTTDPGNFDARADAFLGALPGFQSQANALGSNVYNNAVETANNATTAVNAKDTAVSARDVAVNAKDTAVNAKTETLAARDLVLPARDQTIAARDLVLPARDQTLVARDEAVRVSIYAFSSTSTTSKTIAVGDQSFSIEAGKSFYTGQYVNAMVTSAPDVGMAGRVKSYDASTGALVITVNATYGSGTYGNWSISLGSVGTGNVMKVAPEGTYNHTDSIPANFVTQMSATNSGGPSIGLPLLIANYNSPEFGAAVRWTIESYGIDGVAIIQYATPSNFMNKGWGIRFMRKRDFINNAASPWRAEPRLPSDILPLNNGTPYGNSGYALNRRNIFDTAAPFGVGYLLPEYPADGDVCEWVTNQYSTNALQVVSYSFIGVNGRFGNVGDSLTLDRPFTVYRLVYEVENYAWRIF